MYMENNIAVHHDIMKDLFDKYSERLITRTDFVNYGLEKYSDVLTHKELCLIWQSIDVVYDYNYVTER